ncbi:MAG: HEAT repeat domain-containing protein [Candidatus Solibacter sp.]
MDALLARVAAWDEQQPHDVLTEFSAHVRKTIAGREGMSRLEGQILRTLETPARTTRAARHFLCRELSVIGSVASVNLLARFLKDATVADMACYALARIPDASAGEALRKALAETAGLLRLSVVGALGERRDAHAVAALKGLMGSADEAVFNAAVGALAKIADPAALSALRAALAGVPHVRREALQRACLGAADAAADKGAARGVYLQLLDADARPAIRIGALHGLAAVDEKAARPALVKNLRDQNADMQAAAITLLNRQQGDEITVLLVKEYPALSAIGQCRVLRALADRGDVAARPLVVDAAKRGGGELRVAALASLGKLGDASAVPLLAEIAAITTGVEQVAARDGLTVLRGSGVDAAIAAGIGSANGKLRLEFIAAAGERAAPDSASPLMAAAQGTDPETAQAALRALRSAAGPEHAPALLDLVLHIGNAGHRREAAMTLASVLKRSPDPPIAPLLAAHQASADKQIRLTLLDVMGQASAPGALPVLRASLKDPDPDVARAAILALTAWQTADPLRDLLAVAVTEANSTRQILALRGFIKLMAAPTNRAPGETAALLREGWQLARQTPEKRAILALLPLFATGESMRLAEAAASDPAVAREATLAAETLRALGVR